MNFEVGRLAAGYGQHGRRIKYGHYASKRTKQEIAAP